jgi:hypothetical protein
MSWVMLGAAGMGLTWGWLVVQLNPSLRPSLLAIAGMGAATVALCLTFYVALDGQAAKIGAASSILAALGHLALIAGRRRSSRS